MNGNASTEPATNDDARHEMFVRLLIEHEPQVRSFLRGLLPTWADVEEVTQEASNVRADSTGRRESISHSG